MSNFGDYPPNMAPQNALVTRRNDPEQLAVVQYSADEASKQWLSPANPFKSEAVPGKRKNVPTGYAEETCLSEHTFRTKYRAVERAGGPERQYKSGAEVREETRRLRAVRDSKGSATISDGDGAYVGPWAKYRRPVAATEVDNVEEDELASDEEYEIVEVDEDEEEDEVVESGTVLKAPKHAIDRRKEVEELGAETTILHVEEHDYQGRTYMHVPQDLDISLHKEVGSITNYIPKKQIHGWKQHTGAVTALRFFPESGHLLLSSGADGTVRLWDPYHTRELLRTYTGHTRAVSDVSFNYDGTQFVSGSFDRQMKLWDTETGTVRGRFSTGKTPHVVKFFPGTEHPHEFLTGMSDNKIVQFDTRVGADPVQVQTYDHHLAPVNTVEFYDDNRRFATSSDDKSVRCWEYGIPVPIKYVAEVHMFPYTRSARHPSGKWIAYQSSNEIVVYGANDKFRPAHKKTFTGHNSAGQGIDVAFSPDGQFIASGDTAGSMVFWDWKTRKVFAKLGAGDLAITCVQWHPQETSKVVCAGLDGQIRYFD